MMISILALALAAPGPSHDHTGYWQPTACVYYGGASDCDDTVNWDGVTRVPRGIHYITGSELAEPPPWYRTWWGALGLSLGGMVLGFVLFFSLQDNEDFTSDWSDE